MIKIENEHLSVAINETGAELTSIFDKIKKREILWQGDAKFWTGQAPILFPIVGELKDGKTQINGATFEMKRHGFIKDIKPDEILEEEASATFVFKANDATQKQYPFNFTLKATYTLKGKTLINEFRVENNDNIAMPFTIGGHPAFSLDIDNENQLNDYKVVFERDETSERHFIDENGLYTGVTQAVIQGDAIHLSETIFNDDALVFKDLKSRNVSIENKRGEKLVGMDFKGWPYFGVWAKPNAPYVCLEPWIGCADWANSGGNFLDKELMITINPGSSKNFSFSILT
ncbi:MAG: aldose 1-epimerase family protein [Bacteroidia bacterium]